MSSDIHDDKRYSTGPHRIRIFNHSSVLDILGTSYTAQLRDHRFKTTNSQNDSIQTIYSPEKTDTFQTSSTPTKPDRPKSDIERQGKDHHHSLDHTPNHTTTETEGVRRESRREYQNGFTLGHRGHSSHQQGWRFCGSLEELRGGTSTLK